MTTSRAPRKTTASRQAAEVNKPKGIPVKFKGQTFVVPDARTWSIDAIEAFENGLVVRALRTLLGEDDWARFRKVATTSADLDEFYDVATAAAGSAVPE